MGVSGDAQMQSGAQPMGQVPFVGATQVGAVSSGPCGSQQSSPPLQHLLPQHVGCPPHVAAHGGAMQCPPPQYVPLSHFLPQTPQLNGSFCKFTQWSVQQ